MSRTRCGGVGPSNGQSHAVATMTSTLTPLSWAIATISPICSVASALLRPTLARLMPVGGRHHVFDRAQARRRSRAWRRWGWPPARRTRCRGSRCSCGGEFGGVGQRRHLRRRDERGGLHLAHPGGGDRGEQFQLGRQRDRRLDLQPVAQRHLADVDVFGQIAHSTPSARSVCDLVGGLARAARRRRRRCAGPAAPGRRCARCPAILREHRHDPRDPARCAPMRSS